MMQDKKFAKLLSVYGADFTRWDAADAAAARLLLAESSIARALYSTAEQLERALDAVEAPALPAGLATRAANEALLRAGRSQKARHSHAPARRFVPVWAGALAMLLVLIFAWPAGRGPADVTKFMHSMDRMASRTDQELRDTDDVLGMLSVADATANTPEHADEDGIVPDKVTGEELINTLFDNDAADDADRTSL